jgi:hypothetical protein
MNETGMRRKSREREKAKETKEKQKVGVMNLKLACNVTFLLCSSKLECERQ